MKSAFPEWLKRCDPVLEAETTNGVYQAFRERRVRRGAWRTYRGLFIGLAAFAGASLVWISVVIFLVPLLLTLSFTPTVYFLLNAGIIAAILYFRFRRKPFRARTREFPFRVGVIFSPVAWNEELAVDLWMTGATGYDIAEALYLEMRETWVLELVAFTLAYLAFYGILAYLLHSLFTFPDGVVFSVAYLLLGGVAAVRFLSFPSRALCGRIRKSLRFIAVRKSADPVSEVKPPSRDVLKRRGRRIQWIALVYGLLLAAGLVYYGFIDVGPVRFWVLTILILWSAFGTWSIARRDLTLEVDRCRRVFAAAKAPYTWILLTLLDDGPDSLEWAEGQGIRPNPSILSRSGAARFLRAFMDRSQ